MRRYNSKALRSLRFLEPQEEKYTQVWTTDIQDLSDTIAVRKIQDPLTGHISLAIILDSQTRVNHIEKNWAKIAKIQTELNQIQGEKLAPFLDYLLQIFLKKRYSLMVEDDQETGLPRSQKIIQKKPEYRDLLRDINFNLLVYLICASKIDQQQHKLGKHFFENLLRLFNYGDQNKIDELYVASQNDIGNSFCPWNINSEPITIDKVSNKMETLVLKYGNEPRIPENWRLNIDLDRRFLVWSDWTGATELLKKTYPETYRIYEPRLNARLSEMLALSNNSAMEFDEMDNLSKE